MTIRVIHDTTASDRARAVDTVRALRGTGLEADVCAPADWGRRDLETQSPRRMRIMNALMGCPERSSGALAEELSLSAEQVSGALFGLERDGLVKRDVSCNPFLWSLS